MMETTISFQFTGFLVSVGIVLFTIALALFIIKCKSMTKKLRILGVFGLLFFVVCGVGVFKHFGPDQQGTTAYFLPTQGEIHMEPGDVLPLNLYFYGDATNSIFANTINKPTVHVNNSDFTVQDDSFDVGSAYMDMRIYAIQLKLMATQLTTETITQVTVDNNRGTTWTYDIGQININVEKPPTQNLLEPVDHVGVGPLDGTYAFTLKNGSQKTCTVTEIDFGNLAQYIKDLRIYRNDKQVDIKAGIVMKPEDKLSVEADFKTNVGNDLYYISPKVLYETSNGQNGKIQLSYSLPYGTLGLNVADDKMKEIYEKYFLNL